LAGLDLRKERTDPIPRFKIDTFFHPLGRTGLPLEDLFLYLCVETSTPPFSILFLKARREEKHPRKRLI